MPSDASSTSTSSSAPSTADLPIQEATLELIRWFIPILHRLPRLHRHGLGDRLVANLYELLEQLALPASSASGWRSSNPCAAASS